MLINKLKKIFFKEKFNKKEINYIVENIVKVSETDIFYSKYKIPKKFLSRFEIIVIFIFLLFYRIKDEKSCETKLQKIYDCLFDYIDFSLRELGISDLSIGKNINILAKKFSLRIKIYHKYCKNDFNNIKRPIKKYVYNNANINDATVNKFVQYIISEQKKLKSRSLSNIFVKNCFQLPK